MKSILGVLIIGAATLSATAATRKPASTFNWNASSCDAEIFEASTSSGKTMDSVKVSISLGKSTISELPGKAGRVNAKIGESRFNDKDRMAFGVDPDAKAARLYDTGSSAGAPLDPISRDEVAYTVAEQIQEGQIVFRSRPAVPSTGADGSAMEDLVEYYLVVGCR